MAKFKIKKGRNIKLKGKAVKDVKDFLLTNHVAIQPPDFKGLKPRLAVKVGDVVKKGAPVMTDKNIENLNLVAPASGRIVDIVRGPKRVLLSVIIETDKENKVETFSKYEEQKIKSLKRNEIIALLLKSGLWPAIRQRPFSKIANPQDNPKSIFIQAMNTEPLAAETSILLEKKEKEFQVGLDILKNLTKGQVHLCVEEGVASDVLTQSKGVELHAFEGPHPAGNVSTHIHYIDPMAKGDIVWYLSAQDVCRIASLFLKGEYSSECVVALTGEGIQQNHYVRTVAGASFKDLLGDSDESSMRCLTGSVLAGRNVGANGFLGFYDSQITVIPEGGKRELLGWMMPGANKYTFSKTFVSSFLPDRETSLTADENGGLRAIVFNSIYDEYNALDIITFFLLRAILSGDIEEAEKLGILECDREDFALCTFVCPSKVDVGNIIQQGLDLIEKEG